MGEQEKEGTEVTEGGDKEKFEPPAPTETEKEQPPETETEVVPSGGAVGIDPEETEVVEPGEASAEPPPGQVDVSNEEAQKWIDLQAINAHAVAMRKNLSAAKLNRILSGAGLLAKGDTKHDRQWREDIAEMRKALDLLLDLAENIGPHGLDEPKLVGLDLPTDAEVHELVNA